MKLQGNAEKVTGGCFCGAVRYEAEVYLDDAYYCHCRTCQQTTGAPAEVGVLVKPGSLRFTKGEPKYYQTSHFAERGFCSDCGSRPLSGNQQTIGCLLSTLISEGVLESLDSRRCRPAGRPIKHSASGHGAAWRA